MTLVRRLPLRGATLTSGAMTNWIRRSSVVLGLLVACALATGGCAGSTKSGSHADANDRDLIGAWRSKVQFTGGAFASVKDLEFLYAFNSAGTMTESSNYDGSPPVPPAYGVWRKVGPAQFEAKYLFYVTKPPARFEEIVAGGGWAPGGHGELTERITIAPDGRTFGSQIRLELFDPAGRPLSGGGDAKGSGQRIGF